MKLSKILLFLTLFSFILPITVSSQEEWLVTKSRHFIVSYQEGVDENFLDDTIYYAEKFYNEITDKLGFRRYDYWLWEKRAKIFLYKDQASYVKITGMPAWSGGRAMYETKTIETFPWARGFFSHLLPHELGHIIFREFVGMDVKVPLWFEEGVASSQESLAYQRQRQKILADALQSSSLISLEQLSVMDVRTLTDQNEVNLFYAQAASVISFLIDKFGSYNFVCLCRYIRDDKDFTKALSHAFPRYRTLKELDDDWRYYLKGTRGAN
jgi:hypothetical protein